MADGREEEKEEDEDDDEEEKEEEQQRQSTRYRDVEMQVKSDKEMAGGPVRVAEGGDVK